MTKTILGLDLGTNSIGWALIEQGIATKTGKIIGTGSRIIPMSQDILDKFGSGVSISQTAERTRFRSIRRLRERHLLRRERLHRVLHILGFLPKHYAAQIDFEKRPGQFIPETEPKLAYAIDDKTGKPIFLFKNSFEEMLADFAQHQPHLLEDGKKVPYDWTIYYLRKKALREKIEKEELAWLLLHFNQKRGYYQLRGEEDEENTEKLIEFHALKVADVQADEPQKNKTDIWYSIILENGWVYRRSSKTPLFDWKGKTQEFIVTTDLNPDGSIKKDKEGKEKRSFKAVDSEKDWIAIKKSTENKIEKSFKTVGEYIYETLLQNPNQKIKGKLIRTIERKFYKNELARILEKQQALHEELKNKALYQACLEELYEYNEAHRNNISQKNFGHLFLNDIIFYQRPLKSKKSLISNCKFESRTFIKDGKKEIEPLKGIPKSNPLFQEFRLWKFVQNLRIIQREKEINGKPETDVDVTGSFLKTIDDWVALFDWMNDQKEIDQKTFLKYPPFQLKKNAEQYRWNYVEDKIYPCNETRALISGRLGKVNNISASFLTPEIEQNLWHILYSVEDKIDLLKALKTFAIKHNLDESFIEQFKKIPPFKKEYGAYSAKALKKLLPLMRTGRHWTLAAIHQHTKERIENILTGEYDEKIKDRVREKSLHLSTIEDFQGLPEWLATYIVYDRHSEDADAIKWKKATDIELLEQHSLRNPIVEQVINETLQVVREIWKHYGNNEENFFSEIHVELGREMKNTKTDREKLSKQNIENENTNLRIKALLIELFNDGGYENVRPYSPMQQDILKIYEEGALNAEEGKIPDDILKITKAAQPSSTELVRYKLWLEQKYRSPYTGQIIPLNKLFTPQYEIEHIIPRQRYYDDSFSNKVICEAAVNDVKANRMALEFIINEGGRIVETGFGESVKIFSKDSYEEFVKNHYSKNRGKSKRLFMEDVPESFIQRQLNDSRYISREIKRLLSNIVREENELESTSKNVILCNGAITTKLKQDWGLNDIWNEIITPRFERLNVLSNSKNFGEWTSKSGKEAFQIQMPFELLKGFNKKRIDHRHHSLDAIVVACTTRDHINYLNNESSLEKRSKEEKEKKRYDLRSKLCFKKYNDNTKENYNWSFYKPWESFTRDTKEKLVNLVPSFKQNLRVINKTQNHYQAWQKDEHGLLKKKLVLQTKGDSWAIRKPMHKDTISRLIQLRLKKVVTLSAALDNWEMIADKNLRNHIKAFIDQKYDKKKIIKHFKENENKWNGQDISKVEIYYWDKENVASRVMLNESFNSATIKTITDTGIQAILMKHLKKYNEEKDGKIIEHPELAFSPDGIDNLNQDLVSLNEGKQHQPIYKVRTYEPKGNKFNIGQTGNKKHKYAEAAKGTNLYFAIYKDEKGKRSFDTVQLNIVIERQKQGLSPVPEANESGDALLFYLSPNDLVYIPNEDELNNSNSIDFNNLNREQLTRIYKIVSFTGGRLYAIPCNVATSIVDKVEFTQLNKVEFTLDKVSIRDNCIKLQANRLGQLKRGK
jgi:CRISPR-associated endonuclease Csn1